MNIAASVVAIVISSGVIAPRSMYAQSLSLADTQRILEEYGLPVGPVDGKWGPQTARGICAFRSIAGISGGRKSITQNDTQLLADFNAKYANLNNIKAPKRNNASTYLLVDKTCQTMTYVENESYIKVMPISTGMAGKDTPNGIFTLSSTQKGWSCSTLYPDCSPQTTGRFAKIDKKTKEPIPIKANMYNKRQVISSKGQPKTGGIYVHGSTSVPTKPASHGCIRVTVADSDWMYDKVGNKSKVAIHVVGIY